MKDLILSCSLNKNSFGSQIAKHIVQTYPSFETVLIKDCDFGLCDGYDGAAFENPKLQALQKKIEACDGVIILAPIYNFDVSASCKNLLDLLSKPYKDLLTGKSLRHKTIAFIGTCAHPTSYLAPMNFLAKIMLAHEAFILPKHIILSPDEPENRYTRCIEKLIMQFNQMTLALKDFDASEDQSNC